MRILNIDGQYFVSHFRELGHQVLTIGEAAGEGRVRIELITSATQAVFVMIAEGSTSAQFSADAGVAQASASSAADYVVRNRVQFDGIRFQPEGSQTAAQTRTSIGRISSRRGGLIGKVVRRVARRTG